MTFTLGFVLGCFTGCAIGAVVMCLLAAGKIEDMRRGRDGHEPHRY